MRYSMRGTIGLGLGCLLLATTAALAGSPTLTGSVSDLTYVFGAQTYPGTYPAVDLTAQGPKGWVEFGTANSTGAVATFAFNLATGPNAISNPQLSGITNAQTLALNFRQWSNGSPVAAIPASAFDANTLWGTSAANFAFDVAPDGSSELLKVYISGAASTSSALGTLTATLKDGSGNVLASYTDSQGGAAAYAKLYSISFQAAPTDVLSISLSGAGVGLDFATLSASTVPTPTAALGGTFLLSLLGLTASRRRHTT